MDENLVQLYESVTFDRHDNQFQKGYHHRRRTEILLEILSSLKNQQIILDVGCGDGVQTVLMRNSSHYVTGIDISPTRLRRAKTRANNVVFGLGQVLPFRKEFFDLVYMGELIEHLPNPSECLSEICRALKKKGYLIIDIPSKSNILDLIFSETISFLGLKNQKFQDYLSWGLYTDRTHVHFYSMKELIILASQIGFRCLKIKGACFLRYLGVPLISKFVGSTWSRRGWAIHRVIDNLFKNIPILSSYGSYQTFLFQKTQNQSACARAHADTT